MALAKMCLAHLSRPFVEVWNSELHRKHPAIQITEVPEGLKATWRSKACKAEHRNQERPCKAHVGHGGAAQDWRSDVLGRQRKHINRMRHGIHMLLLQGCKSHVQHGCQQIGAQISQAVVYRRLSLRSRETILVMVANPLSHHGKHGQALAWLNFVHPGH